MKHIKITLNSIAIAEKAGAKIIEGNNWRGPSLKKNYPGYGIPTRRERICQTNSRIHGRCINTVWALYF